MNANPKFLAATAHVDEAAVQPLPNSRKVYVEGRGPTCACRCARSRRPTRRRMFGAREEPADLRSTTPRARTPIPAAKIDIRSGPAAAARAVDRRARRHRGACRASRSDYGRERARTTRSSPSCASTCKRQPRRARRPARTSRRCTTRAAASSRRRWSTSPSARTSGSKRLRGACDARASTRASPSARRFPQRDHAGVRARRGRARPRDHPREHQPSRRPSR